MNEIGKREARALSENTTGSAGETSEAHLVTLAGEIFMDRPIQGARGWPPALQRILSRGRAAGTGGDPRGGRAGAAWW